MDQPPFQLLQLATLFLMVRIRIGVIRIVSHVKVGIVNVSIVVVGCRCY